MTCSKCRTEIESVDELYRCLQCRRAFHHDCLADHLGNGRWMSREDAA